MSLWQSNRSVRCSSVVARIPYFPCCLNLPPRLLSVCCISFFFQLPSSQLSPPSLLDAALQLTRFATSEVANDLNGSKSERSNDEGLMHTVWQMEVLAAEAHGTHTYCADTSCA